MSKEVTKAIEIEQTISKTFRKELWARFIKAITDYKMVNDGDKIAVCMSGGKDSFLLAKCFQILKRYSETNFEIVFIFQTLITYCRCCIASHNYRFNTF